jgi:hypothetical protein
LTSGKEALGVIGAGLDLAYVIDPRFSGGTSAAVAAELRVAVTLGRVRLHARQSAMFKGTRVAPVLQLALDELGLELIWDAPEVSADVVILHNPSFLRFQTDPSMRILTRHLIVVAHENFLRPGGYESFDVARCLDQLDRATLALRKTIAPISAHNRATITAWQARQPGNSPWKLLSGDWFNICDFPIAPPNPSPGDRRGRHSRPGFEKFPSLEHMDLCFPAHAVSNVILGADSFMDTGLSRDHWTMLPFQGLDLGAYFEMIDFMVYFTAPTWRESFGRVLAEAIAAGKLVVSDAETASIFGDAVIACQPHEVDGLIADYVAQPGRYVDQVNRAQNALGHLSGPAFHQFLARVLAQDIRS